jgi:hypothetical protein
MIKVIKNPSFSGYYEIYDDGAVEQEVQGRLNAKRSAVKLARKSKQTFIIFLGEQLNID